VFICEWKRKGKLDRKRERGKRKEKESVKQSKIRKKRSDKRKNRTKGKGGKWEARRKSSAFNNKNIRSCGNVLGDGLAQLQLKKNY